MSRCFVYLSLGICLALLPSCALRIPKEKGEKPDRSIVEWTPLWQRSVYRGFVDIRLGWKKIHFSGLIWLLDREDGTKHVVFQNEMGYSFFSIQWDEQGRFQVNQVQESLNRPGFMHWVRESFEFWLFPAKDLTRELWWTDHQEEGTLCWTQRIERGVFSIDYQLGPEQCYSARVWKNGKWNRDMFWTYDSPLPAHSLASKLRVVDSKKRIQVVLENITEHVVE